MEQNNETRVSFPQDVPESVRKLMVSKIVQSLFPHTNVNSILDQNSEILTYAQNVDKQLFEMATCRAHYYYLVAMQIYKIEEKLDEDMKFKKILEQQLHGYSADDLAGLFDNLLTIEDIENLTMNDKEYDR